MLDDEARARLLTNLGVLNLKGLRQARKKYKLQTPAERLSYRTKEKPVTGMKGLLNAAKRIRCKETGQTYDSQRDAVRHIGGSATNLCDHLKGRRPTFMGYTFEFI